LFSWRVFGWSLRWWWILVAIFCSMVLEGLQRGFHQSYRNIAVIEARARASEAHPPTG
jgi:hypothetical protein